MSTRSRIADGVAVMALLLAGAAAATVLGLATWSFVLAIFALDQATLDRASRIRLPRRTAGLVMDGAWVASRMFGPNNHASTVAAAARALVDSHAARAAPRPSRGSTPATGQTPMGL